MSSLSDNNNNQILWPVKPGTGPVKVNPKADFTDLDHQVLDFWDRKSVFQRSIDERKNCPVYIAYDGPPGTNGIPHIGHIMQSALKDLWPRYYTMKGYRVLRKAGWDTHGLPVELTAEKELGLHSKRDIKKFGVEKYIKYCRETVFRYKEAWTNAIRRCGRFLDTDNYYATLTNDYIQTDWWVLKQAWKKGLLYQGHRVMPHCTRCGTSLSSHETAQGYKDISDISLFVKFQLKDNPDTYFIAWTTTAWTLLSNIALAVNDKLTYLTVKVGNEKYIFAESLLGSLCKHFGDQEYHILERRLGKYLEGQKYIPLWSFLNNIEGNAHQVVVDDYVTAEDGSGIVHLALYGEDDFRIIQKNKIPMVQNVNIDGFIESHAKPFDGRWFREENLDVVILKNLLEKGLLLSKLKITHSYPHCYRCDTPLMYFAKSGWFLKTSSIKQEMLNANEYINWYPEHIKNGRFGNWLENNVDWSISRERYWGSPLPIWKCETCGKTECFASFNEIAEFTGEPLSKDFDPHKPYIDNLKLTCSECQSVMFHETDVLDPWFNAGIMPWGQWGYPAAKGAAELFKNQFPGDFICEAIDQTRGWFYTMLATSTMLTGKSSYKNVICTEHILDDQGQKMSKSKGNIVEPIGQCDKYGADAVRWNFFNVNPWTVRRYKEEDIVEALKKVIIPYWNAYSFFVTYARVDKWTPPESVELSKRLLDIWILSRLEWLRVEIEISLNNYDVTNASNAINKYIDELTNWYIRRSRRRFWKSEDDLDKKDAYNTLYFVLKNLNLMIAPFLPFISETIYQNIIRGHIENSLASVHLCRWPEQEPGNREIEIERQMEETRQVVSLALSVRNENSVRVRQPLNELIAVGLDKNISSEYLDLIKDEINVKSIKIIENPKSLYNRTAKANFSVLGPRFGKEVNIYAEAISNLDSSLIEKLVIDGKIKILNQYITKEEVIISLQAAEGYWVQVESNMTVALDGQIDKQLNAEWLAREFVHHVQNLRKENGYDVIQRIVVQVSGNQILTEALIKFRGYIKNETLTEELAVIGLKDKNWMKFIKTAKKLNIGNQSGLILIKSIP